VIETLRMMGAYDGFIARAFVRRFTLGAVAGAGLGTALAVLALVAMPEGDRNVLGGLSPETALGWGLMLAIPGAAGAMAFGATSYAAHRTLARLR